MGLVGLRPPHAKKVVLGLSGWVKQLGEGLRRAEVREGMGSKLWGDPPSLPPVHGSQGTAMTLFLFFSAF